MKKLKFRGNTKGFTLIELIVIMCIMGFLAAIITPNILTRIARQKKYKAVEACKQAVSAANQLYDEALVYKSKFTADAIVERAGLTGDVKVEVVNDEIVHLFYKNGNESVLYCRYYDEVDSSGSHVHNFGSAYTDPYVCDGTDTLPAHEELYNYIDDMDAANYYADNVADVLPEFGTDSNIEFETETTTAGTTPTSSDDSGETTTSDGSSEPTTSSNASKPFVFDPNVDYSWGGDGVERMYKIVTDWLDSQFFQNATNVIAKDN
jgi:competence protein ComGC